MPQPDIHRYFRHGILPQLRLFEASARLGSFTRAAQELHMAQPTASVQLKKLSETIGVALFEHVGRRLYLTEAGRRLYASCEEVFRVFAALETSLADMRALESGRLRLAVSTTGMCFAPRLLGAFVGLHPGVETSMQAHNRQALVERLARNEDDLYLFADGLLFNRVDADAWSVRGFIYALVFPLLVMSTMRTRNWTLRIALSRRVVFHSTALMATGGYLLFMAAAGYYVRYFGGTWGRALQVALVFTALLALGAMAVSASIRAKLRVIVARDSFATRRSIRLQPAATTMAVSARAGK
jgi:hypothetical protein